MMKRTFGEKEYIELDLYDLDVTVANALLKEGWQVVEFLWKVTGVPRHDTGVPQSYIAAMLEKAKRSSEGEE